MEDGLQCYNAKILLRPDFRAELRGVTSCIATLAAMSCMPPRGDPEKMTAGSLHLLAGAI